MRFISNIIDAAARAAGPRAAFRLELLRQRRWGTGEAEWHVLDRLVDPTRAAIDVGGETMPSSVEVMGVGRRG